MEIYVITLKTINPLYGYRMFGEFHNILSSLGIDFVAQGTYEDFKIAYYGNKSINKLFEEIKCQK